MLIHMSQETILKDIGLSDKETAADTALPLFEGGLYCNKV